MKNGKLTQIKKHVWAATATIVSLYFSFVFAVGVIIGYVVPKVYWKLWHRPFILPIGKRKLHLHHWMTGGLALAAIATFSSFSDCPKIILGGIGGIIVEDFKDMYQPVLGWIKSKTKTNKI